MLAAMRVGCNYLKNSSIKHCCLIITQKATKGRTRRLFHPVVRSAVLEIEPVKRPIHPTSYKRSTDSRSTAVVLMILVQLGDNRKTARWSHTRARYNGTGQNYTCRCSLSNELVQCCRASRARPHRDRMVAKGGDSSQPRSYEKHQKHVTFL